MEEGPVRERMAFPGIRDADLKGKVERKEDKRERDIKGQRLPNAHRQRSDRNHREVKSRNERRGKFRLIDFPRGLG